MMRLFSLYKTLMRDTLSNKAVFMFNIIFPIGMFIYNNFQLLFNKASISPRTILLGVSYYFSYIVFVTILNLIIYPLVVYRETGYYKFLCFLTKSKLTLLFSNLAVQFSILVVELLLFDLAVMLVVHRALFFLLEATLLTAVLFTLPVTLISCIFLVLRLKPQSLSALIMILVFAAFALLNISSDNIFINTIFLFNPVKYLAAGFQLFTHHISLSKIIPLIVVTIIYLLVGIGCISRYNIQPILERN
ncbi:hypothetical protein [Bombilactobacillus bombi]|uniref:hypothetical protein n=1 Tax=Bombilactobacillus bombi TaxID=1303590 RepID=UPI0015E61F28|nr:hypothetical protein [Bombilactobacillus bombi]MBA1435083.1 hypothetical protein [Bombilactobacillus bombi]